MKKIGILFQIANLKVWNKMKDLIDNFKNDFILMTHFNQDLLTENEIEQIVMYYKKKILIVLSLNIKIEVWI